MEFNWLIFPSPDTSYNYDKINGELIFIPKIQEVVENSNNIDLQIKNNNDIKIDPINDELGKNLFLEKI